MTYQSINKILKQALKELELEVLTDEPNITEIDLKQVLLLAKEKLLTEMGVNPQDFYDYEQGLKEIGKAKGQKKKDAEKQALQELENKITSQLPDQFDTLTPEAVTALIDDAISQLPQPTTTIINKIEKVIEKPQIIKTIEHTKEVVKELDRVQLTELKKDIHYLQQTFQDIKIPILPDFTKLKTDLESYSADHISGLLGKMPDWRGAIMGLRGDVDKVRSDFDSFSASENLFDRVGTTLSPHTAGDNVLLTGTLGVGGATNAIQLIVKANVLQGTTTDILQVQDSSGNKVFGVRNNSNLYGGVDLTWAGGSTLTEQTLSPHGFDRMIYKPRGSRLDILNSTGATWGSYVYLGSTIHQGDGNAYASYYGYGNDADIFHTGTYWDFNIVKATTAIRFNVSQFDTDLLVYGDTGLLATFDAGAMKLDLGANPFVTTGNITGGAYYVGATAGIDSTHTVADGDGINYHHYVFTKGILTSYTKNTTP